MAAAAAQRHISDYLELLKVLNEVGADVLIVGGQAVNLWAELFEGEEPELLYYRPFTSNDLDLLRLDGPALQVLRNESGRIEAERDPFGKAFTIVSNRFLIEGNEGKVLPVDDLKMVTGLRPGEIYKGAIELSFANVSIRVLSPILCLKAKLHNLKSLDQRDRQDEKHVRILVSCIRGFARRLLSEAATTGNCRPALNALKQIIFCTSRPPAIRIAREHKVDLTKTIPEVELRAHPNPKLTRFAEYQLPKWHRCFVSKTRAQLIPRARSKKER